MAKEVKRDQARQMEQIFESWNLNIFRKLEEVDLMMTRMTYEAGLCGVPHDFRVQYVNEKIIDMIEQIAENREKTAKKGGKTT